VIGESSHLSGGADVRRVGWFLIVVGGSIAVLWAVLLATEQVPEVSEGRVDIWFHLVAEFVAASLLVAAGLAILRGTPRAPLMAGVAVGALGYTAINSAGYYAEAGEWPPVVMFALLTAATVLVCLRLAQFFAVAGGGSKPTAGSTSSR
jgi:hypothetical protein